jgi:NTP pyrophosphatase (non-canonical NTP hydrolase)
MINKLSKQIHENNKAKGFYEGEKNIGEMIALIHSEVSEALEAHRKGERVHLDPNKKFSENDTIFKEEFELIVKDSLEDELADSIIRLLDLSGYLGIDIEKHIELKVRYNTLRPYKHGKNY